MTKLLIKLFIKDSHNTTNPLVRERYGVLSGAVGIVLNLLLAAAKFIIGTFLAHSIAISADAVNNFSDASSSLLTLIGFKLSGKKPDDDHPFGHGRIEYITALIVGLLVFVMGFELIKTSVMKIKTPEPVTFSLPAVAVLVLSILGKIWLALFNRNLGKRIDSPAMSAVVADSISDTTSTSVTLITLIASRYTDFNLDAYAGIVVALFILYSGVGIIKDTVSMLLGNPPSKELVEDLTSFVLQNESVRGVHDLVIHSYGAGVYFGSLHAEFPANADIIETHDAIDLLEHDIHERYGINMVIHLDPLVFDDDRIAGLRELTEDIVRETDEKLHIHDLRVVDGPTHTNLIFDLVIPHRYKYTSEEISSIIEGKLKRVDQRYFAVIKVEHSYI